MLDLINSPWKGILAVAAEKRFKSTTTLTGLKGVFTGGNSIPENVIRAKADEIAGLVEAVATSGLQNHEALNNLVATGTTTSIQDGNIIFKTRDDDDECLLSFPVHQAMDLISNMQFPVVKHLRDLAFKLASTLEQASINLSDFKENGDLKVQPTGDAETFFGAPRPANLFVRPTMTETLIEMRREIKQSMYN